MRFTSLLSTVLLLISGTAFSQTPIPKKPSPPTVKTDGVDGIELPDDMVVPANEGFVSVQASCKGTVKWLVISTFKIKYFVVDEKKAVIVSVPSEPGAIVNVFAIGVIDGIPTDFVHTVITVEGENVDPEPKPKPEPKPNPNPNPTPKPLPEGKIHYSIAFDPDPNKLTPEIARVLNSEAVRNAITGKGDVLRIREITSPIWAQVKLDKRIEAVGGDFVLVVQNDKGNVLAAQKVPATEKDFLDLISKFKK